MNYKNTKILLTINLEGRLGATVSNVDGKQANNDIMSGKSIKTKMFEKRKKVSCKKHLVLNEDCIKDMIDGRKPSWLFKETANKWKRRSAISKITEHCSAIANGNTFELSVIEE